MCQQLYRDTLFPAIAKYHSGESPSRMLQNIGVNSGNIQGPSGLPFSLYDDTHLWDAPRRSFLAEKQFSVRNFSDIFKESSAGRIILQVEIVIEIGGI